MFSAETTSHEFRLNVPVLRQLRCTVSNMATLNETFQQEGAQALLAVPH